MREEGGAKGGGGADKRDFYGLKKFSVPNILTRGKFSLAGQYYYRGKIRKTEMEKFHASHRKQLIRRV